MALGATAASLRCLVLAESAKLALFGLAAGVCGSILNPLFVHAAPWRNSVRSANVYRRRVSVDAGRPRLGSFLRGAPRASIPYDHCITNSLNPIRPPTSRTQRVIIANKLAIRKQPGSGARNSGLPSPICGTDFGTLKSSFLAASLYRKCNKNTPVPIDRIGIQSTSNLPN
jgi:hypothetical protein